jgi:hypothetical protein
VAPPSARTPGTKLDCAPTDASTYHGALEVNDGLDNRGIPAAVRSTRYVHEIGKAQGALRDGPEAVPPGARDTITPRRRA